MKLQEKIYRLGADRSHARLHETVAGLVRVDEKIDGSQITFGVFDGRLLIRSKGRDMSNDEPAGMFGAGLTAIRAVASRLPHGVTFHGEYLQKPKHNVLAYERVPRNHVVLFDAVSAGQFVDPSSLAGLCETVGAFEPVQHRYMHLSEVTPAAFQTSQLGGVPEGVVIKHNGVAAKLVSVQFHEVKEDKTTRTRPNPQADLAVTLANKYCPPARYIKAVQRLKENGQWHGDKRDIGLLRREVSADLEGECGSEIRDWLYENTRKALLRQALSPLTEWYEQYLTNENAYWAAQRGEETP